MLLRRSAVEDYLQCPQKYYYRWERGLVDPQSSEPAYVGTVMHKIWQEWYKTPVEERSFGLLTNIAKGVLVEVEDETQNPFLAKRRQLGNMVKVMCTNYYNTFGNDTEMCFDTEVQITCWPFTATADGLRQRENGLWIAEHKTGDPDIENLVINSFQSDFYHAILRKSGLETKGTIITVLERPQGAQKRVRCERFEIEPTVEQVEDAWKTAEQVYRNIQDRMMFRHRQVLCGWCSYKKLCYTHLLGGDVEEAIEEHYLVSEKDIVTPEVPLPF